MEAKDSIDLRLEQMSQSGQVMSNTMLNEPAKPRLCTEGGYKVGQSLGRFNDKVKKDPEASALSNFLQNVTAEMI